ncbi:hypothetical protein FGO68_gene2260 [Halteria grandinella]|uniref:Uncharacterized protein n=1 Tax=Halteria grandinella TaxID=5974 RepID=A0A8J8NU58_HALGN|nr:hypothetical protein FGO68_gene2260 [Halteria grandinella]
MQKQQRPAADINPCHPGPPIKDCHHVEPCPLIITLHEERANEELPSVSRDNPLNYIKFSGGGYQEWQPVVIEIAQLPILGYSGKCDMGITTIKKPRETNAQNNNDKLDKRQQFNAGDEFSGLQAIDDKRGCQFSRINSSQDAYSGIQAFSQDFRRPQHNNQRPYDIQVGSYSKNGAAFNCQSGKINVCVAQQTDGLEISSQMSYVELELSRFKLYSYKVIVQKNAIQVRDENCDDCEQSQSLQRQNRDWVKLIRDQGRDDNRDFLFEVKKLQNVENYKDFQQSSKLDQDCQQKHSQKNDYCKLIDEDLIQSKLKVWPNLLDYSQLELEYDQSHQILENYQNKFEAFQIKVKNQSKPHRDENFGDGDIREKSKTCSNTSQLLHNSSQIYETEFNCQKKFTNFQDSKDEGIQVSDLENRTSFKANQYVPSSSDLQDHLLAACVKNSGIKKRRDQFTDPCTLEGAKQNQCVENKAFWHQPEIDLEDLEEHTRPITIMQQRHLIIKDINSQRVFRQ